MDDSPWLSQRDKIKKVVIEDGVTSIDWYAFEKCEKLSSVTIPNSVTSIGWYAFKECTSLSEITLPSSITEIPTCAFWVCTSLSSINILGPITSIGKQAFDTCISLSTINLPNTLTTIYDLAFNNCGIKSITIPKSVTNIVDEPFSGCGKLESIVVEEGNPIYDSRDNCNAIIETKSNKLLYGCKGTKIPNTVTEIARLAFNASNYLATPAVPKSEFNIVIPSSVKIIGDYAFNECKINSITIPNTVEYIGDYVFQDCGLKEAIIYANDNLEGCFNMFQNCNSLKKIFIYCKNIPKDVYDFGSYSLNNATIYVPNMLIDDFRDSSPWKDFKNIEVNKNIAELVDGETYGNTDESEEKYILYARTFNNTSWQALYIPFSMKYEDWKDDFEVAYINCIRQLDKDDDGTIDETLVEIIKIKDGSIASNTPYFIRAKSEGKKILSGSNTALCKAEKNSIDCRTTTVEYTFTGTYNTIPSATMIANNYYAMGGGKLIHSDGSNDLKPYRWYMKAESRNSSYNANNAAKTITINVIGDEEDVTTGIKELQMTNDKLPVYDLNGRKVNENSLKPGIYVKNRKKFVVK